MKKIFSFLLSLVLLVSCSNENEVLDFAHEPADNPASTIRTPDEALALAKQALNLGTTKSRSGLKLSKSNIVVVGSNPLSRGEASDTVIYAVNSEDNNGFVLVAAPRTCPNPILGIAENGSYNESVSENENFNYFMEQARAYAARPNPSDSTITIMPAYIEKVYYCPLKNNVHPEVEWGEKWPENTFCNNGLAGCVPVAIAQTLAFFEYPNGINISFPGAKVSHQTLHWSELKKHTHAGLPQNPSLSDMMGHFDSCTASVEIHDELATLVRQLGVLTETEYTEFVSNSQDNGFATTKSLLNGMNLKYSTGTNPEELYNLFSEKEKAGKHIALLYGVDKAKNRKHTWLSDDFMLGGTIVEYYERGTGQLVKTEDRTSKYLRMNWGWAGLCNGYFLLNVFNPTERYDILQNPEGGESEDYDLSDEFSYMFIETN